MKRRDFITLLGGAAAWPLAARAQQPKQMIGYLDAGTAVNEVGPSVTALRRGLGEGGYVEGLNIEILFRHAEYQFDRLPMLASDLVSRRVAVIIAGGAAPALAAKAATSRIPIVFTTAIDPVTVGLVARLDRPGGNMTGTGSLGEAYYSKGFQLLHELVPGASSIGVLTNPANPIDALRVMEVKSAARALGLRLIVLNARNSEEFEQAFAIVAQERPRALFVNTDATFDGQLDQLVALAARYRVPTVYNLAIAVRLGGLMSYGESGTEALRIAGTYAARILKGEKPGDLPVQLATKIELVVNLKTAKALGLTVPPTLLAIADEVIE
jgi:putative ABC transport system substrate-binding protein